MPTELWRQNFAVNQAFIANLISVIKNRPYPNKLAVNKNENETDLDNLLMLNLK